MCLNLSRAIHITRLVLLASILDCICYIMDVVGMSSPAALDGHQGIFILAATSVIFQSIGSIYYPYPPYQQFTDRFATNWLSYNRALCVSKGLCDVFHYWSF